jgi:hypothetical protein
MEAELKEWIIVGERYYEEFKKVRKKIPATPADFIDALHQALDERLKPMEKLQVRALTEYIGIAMAGFTYLTSKPKEKALREKHLDRVGSDLCRFMFRLYGLKVSAHTYITCTALINGFYREVVKLY